MIVRYTVTCLSIRGITVYIRHLHTWRGGRKPKGTAFTHVPPSCFSVITFC